MMYKFSYLKNKRRWHDKFPAVQSGEGVHYMIKEGDVDVLEVYENETETTIDYYCNYLEPCLAVRTRPQGLLGIQTLTTDTRLSHHAKDEPIRLLYPNAPVTTDEEALWGSGLFQKENL